MNLKMNFNSSKIFENNDFVCDYLLSLSHISTLNGKLDLTAYVVMFVFATAANVILIHSMIKTKETRTNTAKLFLVMAITDLTICIILPFVHEFNIHFDTGKYTCTTYGVEQFFICFLGCSSTIFTFFITLDRFLFIRKSQWHQQMNDTYPIVMIMLVFTYIVSTGTGIAIFMLIYRHLHEQISKPSVVFFSALLVLYVFVLIAELTINISLIVYIRKQAKQLRNITNCQTSNNRHKKATKTVLMISFIQIITTLPPVHAFINVIIVFAREEHDKHMSRIYYMTTWLNIPIILSSLMNAIVFVHRNDKLKTFYKQKISKHKAALISWTGGLSEPDSVPTDNSTALNEL
ncbi:C-C chemokine receptor type 5-like [Clytia hemisphaerica]|uniref:G-protein coupled receptors family 1 profile domain-containing protein n=1 Tax=Clytia hemisphaerica TaxID=252671 RepID=A0A7M5VE00_9CNID|eukprot:TCONS_00060011-protein